MVRLATTAQKDLLIFTWYKRTKSNMASSIQLLPLNPTKSNGISSQGASDNQPDHHITSKPTHALAGMLLHV